MALITKPPAWAYCTTNLANTPSPSFGTSVQASANNADGSSVAGISAITHDVEYLVICYQGYSSTGGNNSVLLDILIDPAGGTSWGSTPLISDLLVGCVNANTSQLIPGQNYYHFPIWIKSGSSIGMRARTAHTGSNGGTVALFAYGGNANPSSWWCGTTVTEIGINAASSQGTDHLAGDSSVFSSWTNFGSTLPYQTGALQFAVHGTNVTTTANNLNYHFEFGVGSTRIGHPILRFTNTNEGGWVINPAPIFCNLPAGTQLQVRGKCNSTAQTLDVAAYAVS
jgi:hypothetical protein